VGENLLGSAIRDCNSNDLSTIGEIENLSFDDPYSIALFQDLLTACPQGFRVIEVKDKVRGYCTAAPSKEIGAIQINSIAVHPDFKRRGLAMKLLNDLIQRRELIRKNSERIILQVSVDNIAAQRLYAKLGFHYAREIRHYYGINKHAMQMELGTVERGLAFL
jgi:[ribosomal protein S18]-alanine N-acetyltransferase